MERTRKEALSIVIRRLRELAEEDEGEALRADIDRLEQVVLRRPAVEAMLHEAPAWRIVGEAEAIERSMQLLHREDGLIPQLYLNRALAGWGVRVGFRVIWQDKRVTFRFWAPTDGRSRVTGEVVAMAIFLEGILFPLQAPSEGSEAAGRQPTPGTSESEPN